MFLLRVGVAAAVLALCIPDARSEEAIDDVPRRPAPVSAAAAVERPKARPAPPVTLTALIDLSGQRMTVSVNGAPTYSWPISSGRAGYRTPTGSFRPQWTARMWYSRTYDMAPMPHAVFFNGGIAVHATSAVGLLGRPASHGCVRLAPANAAAFFNLVARHGKASTRILVRGTARFDEPAIASRRRAPDTRHAAAAPRLPAGYVAVGQRPTRAYGYGYAQGYGSRQGSGRSVKPRQAHPAPRLVYYRQASAPGGLFW